MEHKIKDSKSDNSSRRMARLAAVQGLYQLALMPEPAQALICRFRAHPGVLLQEDQTITAVDSDMFGEILQGVSDHTDAIDTMISAALDERFSIQRLEPLLKAILRAGTFELQFCVSIQTGVIVNDYVDVTHGFFDGKEPGLVNAILDRLAKTLRS